MADAAETYDLAVIGSGPGGYVAAIRAAQLGMKTVCIEESPTLGGTCLNIGCIPSKTLLHDSHLFAQARDEFAERGIKTGKIGLDLKTVMGNKDKTVDDLTKGIEFLFKKNKVERIAGTGAIAGPGEITVKKGKSSKTLKADSILIATGSESAPLSGVKTDEKTVVTSTGALSLAKVPKHLVVIGGGVIGLELGSVWRRFGAKVTVVEFLDHILPGNDLEVSRRFQRILKQQGFEFRLSTAVSGARKTAKGLSLSITPADGGKKETIACDVALLSIGRIPRTKKLGLEEAGVEIDERGFIRVDEDYETSVPGIYAIGDCTPGPMLAHKAEDEGIACIEKIAGLAAHVDYDAIPAIIYTWPEIASVGHTEETLKQDGTPYRKGVFPFQANSRARCNGDTEGFVKILSHESTDALLGCHIVGAAAGDLIQEIVSVIEFGGTAEDVARTCHGHPTLGEAVREAAFATAARAIHI